jgi:hypothetical protein
MSDYTKKLRGLEGQLEHALRENIKLRRFVERELERLKCINDADNYRRQRATLEKYLGSISEDARRLLDVIYFDGTPS